MYCHRRHARGDDYSGVPDTLVYAHAPAAAFAIAPATTTNAAIVCIIAMLAATAGGTAAATAVTASVTVVAG